METLSRRLFARSQCQVPIEYAVADKGHNRKAVLFNSSKTGMYFEAAEVPRPGEDIQIIMSTHTPSAAGPEAFRSYGGRTVWRRPVPDETRPRHGCGVQLLKCSLRVDGADAQFIRQNCDLCNEPTPCHQLCKTSDFIYLCTACQRYLACLPEGHLKNSIKRFLMGNLL